MLFGVEWSARVPIDAEYLYHGSDPPREPRLTNANLHSQNAGKGLLFVPRILSFPSYVYNSTS